MYGKIHVIACYQNQNGLIKAYRPRQNMLCSLKSAGVIQVIINRYKDQLLNYMKSFVGKKK